MPRGPYQGTFQPNSRPTVVTGPDILVYINGETDVIGCPSCRRRFDFNAYITTVQVDLSVESSPGSASINLALPRHSIDEFYFEGNPLITEMMEVEIFAKGYYLVEGVPQYYPIFWGLITEIGDDYDNGEHTISIQCADILKWWELCKMNINPAFTGAAGQQGRSIFGNVFFGMNPFDVIWTCAQQAFGDVVVGSGSLISLVKEQGAQKQVFQEALSDIMGYWEERFSRTRGNLLLYGTNGIAVRGDTLYETYNVQKKGEFKKPFASTAVRNANGGKNAGQMVFDPTDPEVVAFRTQFSQAGQVNFWSSEYQTKLELANAAKEAIGYEFFMDVTGDLVFKPPFYNLDILSNKPVSWIQDIDIISTSLSSSESEVVTQLTMQGSFGGNVDYGMPEDITPYTSITDYHLLRKYGWRSHTINSEFMGDTQLMFYHGLDLMDRINAKRHRGTITIPMRPELRLGFPIYVAPFDQIWYIQGISHSFSFGGRATTTLSLTAKRQKFFAPKGIGTIKLKQYTGPAPTAVAPSGTNPNAANATAGTQKAQPTPRADLPFKYTSRQLSKYGMFQINIGLAATTPPTITQLTNFSKDNPYAPLILRNVKGGRAVGYPNVNMIYTRPFAPPKEQLGKNAGQKTDTANTQVKKKFGDKALTQEVKNLETFTAKQNTATGVDKTRDSLLNNRYQYGLNSAGVFVFVYDIDAVFGEVAFLPNGNLSLQVEGANVDKNTVFGKGSTGMIRPISDARGFEVIGHFRYGRGLALRDGRLVYNPSQKNKAASVDLQVALGGDLFASLTAQSQGITSLTTTYANPVDAITRMQPDDLQTAGIINPTTGKPEFVAAAKNFVDAAPLGSAAQSGQIASVEASQLSRALTIAELNVIKDPGAQDTQCECLTGRRELAFMNIGYQIKPLSANTMGGVAPATGALPEGATQIGGASGLDTSAPVTDEQYRALSGTSGMDKITAFLFDLYVALDKPHQEFESTIRGEMLDITLPSVEDLENGTAAPVSLLSPPFNPANRLAVGDPAAIAAQGNSAKADLKASWEGFSDNLRKNTKKAELERQLKNAQTELNAVTASLLSLQKQQASINAGAANIFTNPPIAEQIQTLQKDQARLQQQVLDDSLQLQQL